MTTCGIPVWLDCDPGHDDAMAMILAGYNPKLRLLGISTCHGNQVHESTTRNAALILKAAGMDHLKVIPGQSKPLMRASIISPEIHGESGLDGTFVFPAYDPSLVQSDEKAVLYLARLIQGMDEPITLIATGPLTNYALLLTLYPELHSKIKQILFMGGAISSGNRTPCSEFNVLADPESTWIVVQSDIPVTMVPLEVTHKALLTDQIIGELCDRLHRSKFCQLVLELLLFFKQTYEKVFAFHDGPPLHDPCAVAILIDPSLFTIKSMGVKVITDDGPCLGQTVCDIYNTTDYPKINVAMDINPPAFMSLLLDALEKANVQSPMNISQ
ncbi:N-D-ribosylpurine ribohydrolase [Halteromyces radiatus]|uniref:N-D-ribosylpurine ribohydrolase n=1 Tax=Halteromyces radiatus TaxID=101107 RepID=UPI00221F57D0|nr:N-D-ribosylpurine ribohydrolase [Halteromyces radiatus]KAI8093074.1 N-D-ribosylpurine ribohydrolase [Halteromyces radiatus]